MSEGSAEQRAREEGLVERVVASFAGTPDPRTRELVEALTGTSTRSCARPA